MKRDSISTGTRWRILQRDNFTCQYCGRSAPDVKLEIDHIKPVAKGGTNDPLNLVTACYECNHGKSAKELMDAAALLKQAVIQSKELQYEKEQYEKFLIKRDEVLRQRKEILDIREKQIQIILQDGWGYPPEARECLSGDQLWTYNRIREMVEKKIRTRGYEYAYDWYVDGEDE